MSQKDSHMAHSRHQKICVSCASLTVCVLHHCTLLRLLPNASASLQVASPFKSTWSCRFHSSFEAPYFPGRLRVHFGNCQLANWTQPLDSFRWRRQYFECFECWFSICVICVPAGDFASLFVFVSVGQGVRPGMLSFHGTAE